VQLLRELVGAQQVEKRELELPQVGREVVGEVEVEELPVSEEGIAEDAAGLFQHPLGDGVELARMLRLTDQFTQGRSVMLRVGSNAQEHGALHGFNVQGESQFAARTQEALQDGRPDTRHWPVR
jgi:hypothetical protein